MLFKSSNPALGDDTFSRYGSATTESDVMSIGGTVNKIAMLLVLVLCSAVWTWTLYFTAQDTAAVYPLMMGGAIGGLVVAFITIAKKEWAFVTAPIYAILKGLALGGISAIYEAKYPGLVIQAVALTMTTLGALLLAYKSGLIKVTENFKLIVVSATGGIALLYLVGFGLSFFNIQIPYIHESGIIGIGFSLFVVAIAALNLVMDFDFIESGAEQKAPKFLEWYAAFGLIVTLIWLYLEFLRLLSKLRD
jgi:uncharacterized YccA/Bax inhibitor family protein